MRARAGRRFFWRVYANGLLLLVLVGVAVFATGAIFGREDEPDPMERWFEYIGDHLEAARSDPARLGRELAAA